MSAGTRLPGTPQPMHYWHGAGGVRIAGDAWGVPGRPLVLLQHGGGQTRHAWRGTGELLAGAGYYAVAFDARGHGDSDWAPDGHYDQDIMVQDLKCVIAALGDARPALVGASMGGGTSLVATGEDHVDPSALVMVDMAPRVEQEGVDKIQAFMNQQPEGFESLEDVARAIANYQPHRPRPRKLDGLGKNVRLSADGKYRWHWDPRFKRGAGFDLEKRRLRLEACARNLKLPILIVRGGMSDVLTERGVQEFRALCPHSEYVNIADAAHMVAGDRNDTFGNAVIDFLRRAVPAPPHTLHPHHEGPPGEIQDIP